MKKLIPLLFLVLGCSSLNYFGKGPNAQEEKKKEEAPDPALCICMEIYRPVCGKDGKTYGNACEADCIQMKHSPGACPGD